MNTVFDSADTAARAFLEHEFPMRDIFKDGESYHFRDVYDKNWWYPPLSKMAVNHRLIQFLADNFPGDVLPHKNFRDAKAALKKIALPLERAATV